MLENQVFIRNLSYDVTSEVRSDIFDAILNDMLL